MVTFLVRRCMALAVVLLVAGLFLSCSRDSASDQGVPTVRLRPGQESIQAVLDRVQPRTVIALDRGKWTENVRITRSVVLRGAGPGKTVVQSGTPGQPVVWIAPSAEGVTVVIENLTLTGAAGGAAHGLVVEGSAAAEVRNCAIVQNEGNGIVVVDKATATIFGGTIAKNGRGLEIMGQARATITGTAIRENRNLGILVSEGARLELARSTVSENGGSGLWVRDMAQAYLTGSMLSKNAGHGVWIRDRALVEAAECFLSNNAQNGFLIEHRAQALLVSCTISGNWDGLELRGTSRVRVVDCVVSDSRWDGIKLREASRAEVLGCFLSRGRGSGITLLDLAQAEVRHNRIDSWSRQGILSLSQVRPWGEGNRMWGNGVDLSGNLGGELRVPLREAVETEVALPNPRFGSLQEAVDALLPGGNLVLGEGTYTAGVTLAKPLRIEARGTVLLLPPVSAEAAVLSLVAGAEVFLAGVAVGQGSEGLFLGADARAILIDCVVSDNNRGFHVANTARIELLRCSVSRNTGGGFWLGESAQAKIEECAFVENKPFAIGLGDGSRASIVGCFLTESGWTGAVVLRDSAQGYLEGNTITGNYGLGVALYHRLCIGAGYVFTGKVSGGHNAIGDNYKGDVCPEELGFLTGEGGELDLGR